MAMPQFGLPLRGSDTSPEATRPYNTPQQPTRAYDAAFAPEYSLLICGRPRTITTDSALEWTVGPLRHQYVKSAVLDLATFPDSPITLFNYIPHQNSPAGVIREPPPRPHCWLSTMEADQVLLASVALHKALNLTECRSGFLFVHDASDREVEESILCLRRVIELLYRNGGRGFWVVINTAVGTNTDALGDIDSVAARFEQEFTKWPELDIFSLQETGPRVLQMPTEAAYHVVGDAMRKAPRLFPRQVEIREVVAPGAVSDSDFLAAFRKDRIAPWKHEDYLRAAYLTLLDPENRDLGLLEIATKFAADVNAFKQRNSQIQPQPESRFVSLSSIRPGYMQC